jgi:lipid-binding SYLF domain-containing protein
MRLRQITISAIAFFLTVGVAHAASKEETRVMDATDVVDQLLRIPEQGIPARLLSRAYAVAVIPRVLKVSFALGARYGRGILVVRQDDHSWSNPAFIRLTGGSFGFQAGAQSTDIILVFKNRSSVDGLTSGKLTLGADVSVAAGPVGRTAEAATDWTFSSEVYSYSRGRGLFAGVALQGAGVTMDRKANAAFYGNPGITPEQILAGSGNAAPQAASNFVQVLTAHTNGLPMRPSGAAAVASSERKVYPQEQSRSEVKTYGMNNNQDDELRD